jgi:hypothetical protein
MRSPTLFIVDPELRMKSAVLFAYFSFRRADPVVSDGYRVLVKITSPALIVGIAFLSRLEHHRPSLRCRATLALGG